MSENKCYFFLKPCPFCGCDQIDLNQSCKNGLRIKCRNCGINKEQKVLRFSLEFLEQKMVENWNTRIELKEPLKDALEKYADEKNWFCGCGMQDKNVCLQDRFSVNNKHGYELAQAALSGKNNE